MICSHKVASTTFPVLSEETKVACEGELEIVTVFNAVAETVYLDPSGTASGNSTSLGAPASMATTLAPSDAAVEADMDAGTPRGPRTPLTG